MSSIEVRIINYCGCYLFQSNKLPGSVLVDKPGSSVPNQLDPLLVQMGNMHSLQNRMQTPGLHNHLPSGVPANLSSSLPPDGLGSSIPNLQTPPMGAGGMSALPGIHGSLPSGLPGSVNVNRPTSHTPIDQLPPGQDSDPIANFLKQFQQQRQLPVSEKSNAWCNKMFTRKFAAGFFVAETKPVQRGSTCEYTDTMASTA
jgi:hypothetical protein